MQHFEGLLSILAPSRVSRFQELASVLSGKKQPNFELWNPESESQTQMADALRCEIHIVNPDDSQRNPKAPIQNEIDVEVQCWTAGDGSSSAKQLDYSLTFTECEGVDQLNQLNYSPSE